MKRSHIGLFVLPLMILGGWMAIPEPPTPEDPGELLAQQYCQSCHLLPKPEHLDQATWLSKVFPMMRTYLGMDPLAEPENMTHDMRELFPDEPRMTEDEWFELVEWFLDNAPDVLPATPVPPVDSTTSLFVERQINRPIVPVMSTLARFDTVGDRLLIGDGTNNAIWIYGTDGRIQDSVPLSGPPSSVVVDGDIWYVTDMGSLFPHDTARGALTRIDWSSGSPEVSNVLDPILRPTSVQVFDINEDGRDDYLVCEYGNIVGQFGWYEVDDEGTPTYHPLISRPGAIRSELADLNGDGRMDIVVQMAQAREGIYAFLNQGRGTFEMMDLAVFPPSFGSSSFTLTDWNHNGMVDLLVTTGDNGDYDQPPYKPYHGTRVFLNQGDLQFEEDRFIPFDGAYGAIHADFDLDGTDDLFTYAYFARLSLGTAAMIRFHRDVNGANTVSTTPDALSGRWLPSDCADIDHDGDLDLLLGNVSYGPGMFTDAESERWITGGRLALFLENQAR